METRNLDRCGEQPQLLTPCCLLSLAGGRGGAAPAGLHSPVLRGLQPSSSIPPGRIPAALMASPLSGRAEPPGDVRQGGHTPGSDSLCVGFSKKKNNQTSNFFRDGGGGQGRREGMGRRGERVGPSSSSPVCQFLWFYTISIVDNQLILGPGHLSPPQLGCCPSSSLRIGVGATDNSLGKAEGES